MNRPELVAPAATIVCAEAAMRSGADAVYAGVGPHNLRANAPNLSMGDLRDLLELRTALRRKAYVVLNSMPDDRDLEHIRGLLVELVERKTLPDALIVSDPGVLAECRKSVPQCRLHLSTQTGTFNTAAMRFWADQGIRRVVLPRECTLEQIAGLSRAGCCETEVFIHGAMCVAVSGRCLLGAYQHGRHANRGDCPQPCRSRYRIQLADRAGGWLDAEEDGEGAYLLNSKDLNSIEILPSIIAAGVSALKIEGRNKTEHYVATVCGIYRQAIDACMAAGTAYRVSDEWRAELDRLEHRPYTTGFYAGEMVLQDVRSARNDAAQRIVGIVKAFIGGGLPVIDVKNRFCAGEALTVSPVSHKLPAYPLTFTSLTDLGGVALDCGRPGRLVVGWGAAALREGDLIRRENGR